MGIKSIESNFNPKKKTYNPHFHLIVPDRKTAEILQSEWIERGKKKGRISWKAQDMREIKDREACLIEVVKYGSKIFTEQDVNNKALNPKNRTIYAKALFTILAAMRNQRVFDRFGFNLPKAAAPKMNVKQVLRLFTEFSYDPSRKDWVEDNFGFSLTDFKPDPRLLHILEDCINKEVA